MKQEILRFDGFNAMLKHFADTTPTAPALAYEDRTLSFEELYEQVLRQAIDYVKSGASCLGVLADGSLSCVISIFGAVLAGMQVVMLDESLPEDTLRQLLVYADVDLLYGDEDLVAALSPSLVQDRDEESPFVKQHQLLFFTSGTTRRQKAVVLTDESLMQSAWNGSMMLPLTPSDRLLCLLPLGHVFGFVCGLLWGLSSGACVCLGRGARHYMDDIAYYQPTAVSVVPLLLGYLLKADVLQDPLRLVLVGAGSCSRSLLDAVTSKGIQVSFGYGLTETSSGVAISTSGDPYKMAICPDDEITLAPDGEVLIKAPTCMMQGYYKLMADTLDVLQDGVLHTGDLGTFDGNGLLTITGRKKDILVLPDGTKIFLPEYEAALISLLGHPELAVTESDGRPVLIYAGVQQPADSDPTATSGSPTSKETLRQHILEVITPYMQTLPRGQQISRIVITSAALPRATATGKLKRWQIGALLTE